MITSPGEYAKRNHHENLRLVIAPPFSVGDMPPPSFCGGIGVQPTLDTAFDGDNLSGT
jgi:hypothetical protein